MDHVLLSNVDIQSIPTTLAGTAFQIASAVDGAFVQGGAIDTQGYEAVAIGYKVGAGTVAAVVALKLQDSDLATGPWSDLAGSLTTVTDVAGSGLNRWVWVHVVRPRRRFITPLYQRTVQNSALDTMIAIRYRKAQSRPIVQSTALGGAAAVPKVLTGPPNGTA